MLSKSVIVDISVDFIKDNPGCSNFDIEHHFENRRRVDGRILKFPPTKREINSLLHLDKRVYNKNKGLHNVTPSWHFILDAEDR